MYKITLSPVELDRLIQVMEEQPQDPQDRELMVKLWDTRLKRKHKMVRTLA